MSNKRYIELYSGNRNRNQYPLQSSFEVPFAPTRQLSSNYQAFDPLCSGPILYKWSGGTSSSSSITPPWTLSATSPDANSTPGCIYLTTLTATAGVPPSQLSSIYNYYVGYQLDDSNGNYRTIVNYDPVSAKFTLDLAFPTITGITVNLSDPSSSSIIHIPSVDVNKNNIRIWSNAYDGCYIVDETQSDQSDIVYGKIISYNSQTQLATLDRSLTNWSINDNYTIRKTLPQEKYILSANPTNNNSTFVYYNGIIYNSSSLSITMINASVSIPGMIVTLPLGQGNREQNYYAGKYVYNTTNGITDPNNPSINGGGIYGLYFIKASSYNQSTNLVELLVDHSSIPQISCSYNSATSNYTKSPSPVFLKTGDVINIVNFIKDNYSPLNYNGSVVSQSETVCYEVSLISLTLPNTSLRSGARAAFYPFFYVEFTNTTSPSGSSNSIIYSNSPNSSDALFIAPITDTAQPLNSSFVKIYSNMSQTVKFKPNDSLRFSVYLPDGRPFETVEQDTLSPYEPNGVIQIDAVFGIRRI